MLAWLGVTATGGLLKSRNALDSRISSNSAEIGGTAARPYEHHPMRSALPQYFIIPALALLLLAGLCLMRVFPGTEPASAVTAVDLGEFVELAPPPVVPDFDDRELAAKRISLSPALPPEPPKPAAPEIPLDAVSMRFQRWPDLAPLEGVGVQLVDTGRNEVSQRVIPLGSRLRLADSLREDLAAIHVRAEGFEAARVTGSARGKGIEYLAVLRPEEGYYGQVVDHEGKPMAGVQVRGFWAEAPRPLRNYNQPDVMGSSVRSRVNPAASIDPDLLLNKADGQQGTPTYFGRMGAPKRKSNSQRLAQGESNVNLRLEPSSRPSTQRSKPILRGGPFKDSGTHDILPAQQFLASHAELRASAVTDAEGWYYVEPLDGFVLGHLQLWADDLEGASDILRTDIPRNAPSLPKLIVHRPRPVVVTVIDKQGLPMEGAQVIFKLAEGWSPEWEPMRTDEEGRVIFQAPSAELLVAVEKAGHKLAEPEHWRPESADRLWRQLQEITPKGQSSRALFKQAYSKWRTPLPRARGYLALDMWTSDVQASMTRVGIIQLEVTDAEHKFPLVNARISLRYGGLDPGQRVASTDNEGHAPVSMMDREWQPMVVTVSTPGYVSRTFALPPGPLVQFAPRLRVALREERMPAPWEERHGTGLVLGANGPSAANVAIYNKVSAGAKLLYSGSSNSEGVLKLGRQLDNNPSMAVFAVQTDARTGQALAGYSLGPLPTDDVLLGGELEIQLQATLDLAVSLTALESERPYRLDWSLRPFKGASTLARGQVLIPENHGGRFDLRLPVPVGWILEAQAFGASVGHGPIMAFTRPDYDAPYASIEPSWDAWKPVSRGASQLVSYSGRKLFLTVLRREDLSGVVLDLPYFPEHASVAAIGAAGTWYSGVGGTGWFAFRNLPVGEYRLVLYERPNSEDGPNQSHTPGQVRGETKVMLEYSHHSVELAWIAD